MVQNEYKSYLMQDDSSNRLQKLHSAIILHKVVSVIEIQKITARSQSDKLAINLLYSNPDLHFLLILTLLIDHPDSLRFDLISLDATLFLDAKKLSCTPRDLKEIQGFSIFAEFSKG